MTVALKSFFSHFPLHAYPPILSTTNVESLPSLWIHPPLNPYSNLLSSDVECLKWQAYLALRNISNIFVRWDVAADGGIGGHLPNLLVPSNEHAGELLDAHMIPGWVDAKVQMDVLEGYRDEIAKNESRAWISLLESTVHAALVLFQPQKSSWIESLSSASSDPVATIETLITPPPAPLTGITSLLPPFGKHIDVSGIQRDYNAAIASLSERLGTDKWFLASPAPTALDALVFAYLYSILQSKNAIRFEVTRRVNLVSWERRVENHVKAAFRRMPQTL